MIAAHPQETRKCRTMSSASMRPFGIDENAVKREHPGRNCSGNAAERRNVMSPSAVSSPDCSHL
jgi:hypothetical protein